MVVIRLARSGSKKKPFYNVVVTDSRARRDGRFIEKIGFYNPVARGQEVALRLLSDKYNNWIEKGAQPSDRVCSLYTLWLKNGSKDVAARMAKTDRTPVDINDKPAQRKIKEPEIVATESEDASVAEVSEEVTEESTEKDAE